MIINQCMTDKTVERSLSSPAAVREGDQSCPLPPAN
jgi:hypothetical protein